VNLAHHLVRSVHADSRAPVLLKGLGLVGAELPKSSGGKIVMTGLRPVLRESSGQLTPMNWPTGGEVAIDPGE
jgi:hypothetical protein